MFRPVGFGRDFGDYGGEQALGGVGVGVKVSDNCFRGHRFLIGLPAIVIGDHGHGGERDLGFAGELRLGEIRHADHIEAEFPVGLAFGSGRKLRTVHIDVRAAIVGGHFEFAGRGEEEIPKVGADRVGKGDVANDATAEEGVDLRRAIEELVREDDVTRVILLLQRADGGDADDPSNAERAKRPDVGAVGQFVRQNAVSARVPRQKEDGPSADFAAEDDVRRRAVRSVDGVFASFGERVDLIEAAASDNANGWFHAAEE